jgi:hypothetical protein
MPVEKRMIMSSVYGISGTCEVCGTDQEAFVETLSPLPAFNSYVDWRTNEKTWTCLACGYGYKSQIIWVQGNSDKEGSIPLWEETFWYPMDEDKFVKRPALSKEQAAHFSKSVQQRKAEHLVRVADALATDAVNLSSAAQERAAKGETAQAEATQVESNAKAIKAAATLVRANALLDAANEKAARDAANAAVQAVVEAMEANANADAAEAQTIADAAEHGVSPWHRM